MFGGKEIKNSGLAHWCCSFKSCSEWWTYQASVGLAVSLTNEMLTKSRTNNVTRRRDDTPQITLLAAREGNNGFPVTSGVTLVMFSWSLCSLLADFQVPAESFQYCLQVSLW